jgi:phosphoenolpyruvate carboxylase
MAKRISGKSAGARRASSKDVKSATLRSRANTRKTSPRTVKLDPGLMPLAHLFPEPKRFDAARVEKELRDAIGDFAGLRERNPFGNTVKLLALEIGKRIDRGALGFGAIEDLIQHLAAEAYGHRAERIAAYLGELDRRRNEESLRATFRRIAGADAKGRKPKRKFAEFRAIMERELYGVVITAHPTFSQSKPMMCAMAELAMDRDGTGAKLSSAERTRLLAQAHIVEHRPPEHIDLTYEHELSLVAIQNIHRALHRAYEIAFEVAAECYPEEWESLSPRLLTISSWVGYDLDGRSDIRWSDTLLKRLKVQLLQLERYMATIEDIRGLFKSSRGNVDLIHLMDLIESRLALGINEARDEIDVFRDSSKEAETWIEEIRRIAKRMYGARDVRLIESAQLLDLVQRAIAMTELPAARIKLLILRAEIANHGLGLAHTQVRLNAVQIHNAIRNLIEMEAAPDDPSHKRSYMASISKLAAGVKPVRINFASILAERTSAKRLLMIVAQMLKYIDATTPVRFLIAECETALTLMAALYFAKLFGVDHKVDISPLFETTKAFERGVRVIDECLQNPTFADYVRRRGRLCIQTGFSDAGRHLGQTVAAISVEWLRLKLGELLRDRGFTDIELVVFDTHGESIGRGGHQEDFRARLEYVASPVSRREFVNNGIRVKEETSFQGGDGYLYFITPQIAFVSVTRILEYMLEVPTISTESDPAYKAEEDYIKETFITVRRFNERVMNDPAYAALLDTFGGNLFFPSGSRPIRREQDGFDQRVHLTHPAQMRAIPHNGILQQIAFFANTLGGVGGAIARDPERFQRLYRASPRLRRLLGMVEWALEFTDLESLKCYIDLYDPGQWLSRAYQTKSSEQAVDLRAVAEHLETEGLHDRLTKIYRVFQEDMLDLREGLALVGLPNAKISAETRANLRVMHGIRIALIMRIFILSTHVPDFSQQHGITREQLLTKIFHLEIDDAMRKLAIIFPKVEQAEFDGDFGVVATYVGDWSQTYEREHARIFQPIGNLYTLVRRLSSGITHTIGAIG